MFSGTDIVLKYLDYFLIQKITGLQYIAMDEGGGKFGYKDPNLDNKIDRDDDEQEVNRTQPFEPDKASTP